MASRVGGASERGDGKVSKHLTTSARRVGADMAHWEEESEVVAGARVREWDERDVGRGCRSHSRLPGARTKGGGPRGGGRDAAGRRRSSWAPAGTTDSLFSSSPCLEVTPSRALHARTRERRARYVWGNNGRRGMRCRASQSMRGYRRRGGKVGESKGSAAPTRAFQVFE